MNPVSSPHRSSGAPAALRGAAAALLATVALLTLAGCANPFSRERLDSYSITYKINIQQGVVVTQEMADQLQPGMSRDQVRFILGTPILTDPFHADRWDYPFRFQPGRGKVEERRFAVFFDSGKLVRWNGDSLPTEEEFAASRNFATTRIVRAPAPLGRPLPQLPGTGSDISNTTVIPGTVATPNRPNPGTAVPGPQPLPASPQTNDSVQ